jgi:hypothetical protein
MAINKVLIRTDQEIDQQIDKAHETNGKLFGMTYEQGVIAALEWITESGLEKPIEDE